VAIIVEPRLCHVVMCVCVYQRQHIVGCVYRVHFQLVQMFESYCKLVTTVANQAANVTQVQLSYSYGR